MLFLHNRKVLTDLRFHSRVDFPTSFLAKALAWFTRLEQACGASPLVSLRTSIPADVTFIAVDP